MCLCLVLTKCFCALTPLSLGSLLSNPALYWLPFVSCCSRRICIAAFVSYACHVVLLLQQTVRNAHNRAVEEQRRGDTAETTLWDCVNAAFPPGPFRGQVSCFSLRHDSIDFLEIGDLQGRLTCSCVHACEFCYVDVLTNALIPNFTIWLPRLITKEKASFVVVDGSESLCTQRPWARPWVWELATFEISWFDQTPDERNFVGFSIQRDLKSLHVSLLQVV